MPTYDYECTKCGHRFELQQAMNDKPRSRCPECRGKVIRLVSGGLGVVFKGNGFYVKDSQRPAPEPTGEAAAACDTCPAAPEACPAKKKSEPQKN